jgi:hypothetical protein
VLEIPFQFTKSFLSHDDLARFLCKIRILHENLKFDAATQYGDSQFE